MLANPAVIQSDSQSLRFCDTILPKANIMAPKLLFLNDFYPQIEIT